MKVSTLFAAAVSVASFTCAEAAKSLKDKRTFGVVYFGGGKELTRCRLDPVVNPGGTAAHLHSVIGGNAFAASMPGDHATTADCTNTKVKNDHSNYWFPSLYFKNPSTGVLMPVEMYYAKVYYFFEPTNDKIQAFPPGFRMLTGDASLRAPPATPKINLDPSEGPIVNTGWVCPRKNDNSPLYPPSSDGTKGVGIQNTSNGGAGFGFPDKDCDGLYSPMRADIHFPSCYNPKAGPENYKENTAFPSDNRMGGKDCPEGWIHTPHLFYEVYWHTQPFAGMWEQGKGTHPWVLSNGDTTGYSLHADFVNGWDQKTLQYAIDNCDTGNGGLHECAGLPGGETPEEEMKACKLQCPLSESSIDKFDTPMPNNKLLGNNALSGYSPNPYKAPGGPAPEQPPVKKPTATPIKPENIPTQLPSRPHTTMYVVTVKPQPQTTAAPVYNNPNNPKTVTTKKTRIHKVTKTIKVKPASTKPAKPTKTCNRNRKHSRHGGNRHHGSY